MQLVTFSCPLISAGQYNEYYGTFESVNRKFSGNLVDVPYMIVEVNQGKLRGLKTKSALTGKEYYSFLGIPYARPPTGDLRFHVRTTIDDLSNICRYLSQILS